MAGLGHMLHTSQTIKNNWENRKKNRKDRKKKFYTTNHNNAKLKGPQVSPAELEKIKSEIRLRGKKQRKKNLTLFLSIGISLFALIYIIYKLNYLRHHNLL
ncbi:hypothetical protein KH5_19240 [Urechidicola sp. KH5]